jgi:hypothetical protein
MQNLLRHFFQRYIEEGWLACEQAFIHDARAAEYERLGRLEDAKWQRDEADKIRLVYGQTPEQWLGRA